MKTTINFQLAIMAALSLLACSYVRAQSAANVESNIYPINSGGLETDAQEMDYNNQELYHYLYEQRMSHEIVPETLPALQDTNGNWGEPVADFQLSIRFREHDLLKGEPAMAVIILRNLNSNPRTLVIGEYSFKYTLTQGTNISIYELKRPPRGDADYTGSEESWDNYNAHGEGLMAVHLNRLFNLDKPGEYSIQAQMRVPTVDGKMYTNVISGFASFEIVEKLTASEIASRNVYAEQVKEFQQLFYNYNLSRSNANLSTVPQTNAP